MRQCHHNIFLIDQVFDINISGIGSNLCATLIAELITHQLQLFANHFHQTIGVRQNAQQLCDLLQQTFILIQQLLVLKTGQFLQTQIQNRLSLLLGQIVLTVTDAVLRIQPLRTSGIVARTFQHR